MPTITYREAKALDISNIARLFMAAEKELEVPYPTISEKRAVVYIANMLADGVVRVADLSGRLVGAVLGIPIKPAWSDLWVVEVPQLLVEPHFRRHGIAQYLIKTVTDWAHEKGLPVKFHVDTGGSKIAAKDRFMAMRGLTYMGGSFMSWPKDLPAR